LLPPHDHPLNLIEIGDQVGAAKLDLLSSAAWTRRISVNRHGKTMYSVSDRLVFAAMRQTDEIAAAQ
jgi:hypothetical protein